MGSRYRSKFIEKDLSGFVSASIEETGIMVVKSIRGRNKPTFCTSENDVITLCGYPSADYPGVFEALSFVKKAPLWISCVIGDNPLWGGVDVKENAVVGFGTGRVDPDNFSYSAVNTGGSHNAGSGDGIQAQFTGTIPDTPIDEGSLVIKIGGVEIDAEESGGDITGTDISGTGTLDKVNGTFDFTLDGIPGEVATVTGDQTENFDLSTNKYVNITIDGTLYENVDLSAGAGTPSAVTASEVASAINAVTGGSEASDSGGSVKIDGAIGSSTVGHILVEDPTSGASALIDVFSSGGSDLEDYGTDPTGAIPTNGQDVDLEYVYNEDISATVSHSFFATSPYEDDLVTEIEYLEGKKFKLTLYRNIEGREKFIVEYEYSLEREKKFGRSIYIFDVFDDNDYVVPTVNINYVWTAPSFSPARIDFSGGSRGEEPLQSDYNASWDLFKSPRKYPGKILMDVYGDYIGKLNDICTNYQVYAHGISIVPIGTNAADAITYRQGLSLDSDKVSLYTNWAKIEDPYNDSFAWISNVGAIGAKYAMMEDVYDSASPAGVDENNHGGQLGNFWRFVEVENDYDDPAELQLLDEAQINPVIFDETYGVMVYGDKTCQVSLSDTSFVGHRRLFNYIAERIVTGILRRQEFKNNDTLHRTRAKVQTDEFLSIVNASEAMREFYVVCNEQNNNDLILQQRKFILDIYIKVTPNSQFTQLNLTRVSQSQVIAELIQ